jgi:hypothetical protein
MEACINGRAECTAQRGGGQGLASDAGAEAGRGVRRLSPRCILLLPDGQRRCPHPAARRMGDLYTCTRHGRITLALLDDWMCAAMRRMLAYARWNTAYEGQRLIRLHRKEAA